MTAPSAPSADRQAKIGKLRDITSSAGIDTNPFLHYLPDLFERNILNPITIDGYIVFAENALRLEPRGLVIDALKVLNQLINPEDSSLLTPNPQMLQDNSHFKWQEFGTFTDPKSVISHIINKCSLVLSLGKV